MKRLLTIAVALTCAAACHRETRTWEGVNRKAMRETTATAKATTAEEAPAASGPTEVGDRMPAYQAKLLDGKPLDLAAERKNVVFLNVWATWCGPCRFETPELQKMHEKYKSRGFEVVGVAVDENGAEAVKPFVDEMKITYPIALDTEGKIANLLQTTVLPTSVVIDRSGKIVWRRIGALVGQDATLDAAIEKALK